MNRNYSFHFLSFVCIRKFCVITALLSRNCVSDSCTPELKGTRTDYGRGENFNLYFPCGIVKMYHIYAPKTLQRLVLSCNIHRF
jgi:hypothetical protein